MTWLHIHNAHLFAPQDLGTTDVLIWNGRIVSVGPNLTPPPEGQAQTVDAKHRPLLPGLVDPHAHIMGASGPGGPTNRTPDQPLSRLTTAGITTVISPLGTDSLSRTLSALLMRAEAVTQEGITAYAYTGGWTNPIPTLTGDPQSDITFIPRFLGIKIALSEPLAPELSLEYICRLAHAAVVGGRFANKSAVLHAHIGDRPEGLAPLWDAAKQTGLPPERFVATHVNRNPGLFQQALEFARAGGSIDITTQCQSHRGYPNAIDPSQATLEALHADIPLERLSLSTNSGGAYARPNEPDRFQMAEPHTLFQTLQKLSKSGTAWNTIAMLASHNASNLLGLSTKGRIAEGADADLILLTEGGDIDRVWSRGRLMVEGGKAVVKSDYE